MSKNEAFAKICDRAIDKLYAQLERGEISPEDYEVFVGEIQSDLLDYELHGPWWMAATA